MTTITKHKHEIMWWMTRITFMVCALCFSIVFAASAYAADTIQMGAGGNLIFEPNELTVKAGDTVTFVNGELPPHNVVFLDHDELSHSDLAFMSGEQFPVTFTEPGEYEFQCEPHAGAGMKGVIHVE